ncbi:MAG: P-loop NTPase fold protein, partial [candidate division WOR-3 bacterium]
MDKCEIRLLEDIPVEEDKLGALQTIVDSIVAVIENNKGGKSILLEGIWGSGKSSVIKLLQKRYRDDRNVAIVIFDAWGHQGDPLRRSFLES